MLDRLREGAGGSTGETLARWRGAAAACRDACDLAISQAHRRGPLDALAFTTCAAICRACAEECSTPEGVDGPSTTLAQACRDAAQACERLTSSA